VRLRICSLDAVESKDLGDHPGPDPLSLHQVEATSTDLGAVRASF
jgi:hypothetical protein